MATEMGTNSRGPYNTEVNRLAKLLMDTWYKVDPKSSVTIHPASYVANFADMAKTIIADRDSARAMPDVTELERYANGHNYMKPHKIGEYVRHDQAAAIIADKDDMIMRTDRFAQTYLRHMKNAEQGVADLKAKVVEYFAAKAAYDEAVKPSGAFGHPKVLKYGDPIVQRYRDAALALNPSIADDPQ